MAINRRDFLKGSLVVGAIPALGFIPTNIISDDFSDTVKYQSYDLYWSGYSYEPASMKLYGTWTAKLVDNYILYASNVGLEGIIREGAVVPLFCKQTQVFPHIENFIANKGLAMKQKLDALTRIKDVIFLWNIHKDVDKVNDILGNR